MASTAPKVVSVEVVAERPTETDRSLMAQLAAEEERPIAEAAFIVRIRLAKIPPPTGHGWALYVGDTRIPKYWEYPDGIYFKVLDEQFLADHRGQPLRFSENDEEFIETGAKLPRVGAEAVRATAARTRPRTTRAKAGKKATTRKRRK